MDFSHLSAWKNALLPSSGCDIADDEDNSDHVQFEKAGERYCE
jgi:hypothetical protein